jgi:hypothetical protein
MDGYGYGYGYRSIILNLTAKMYTKIKIVHRFEIRNAVVLFLELVHSIS